MKIGLKKLNQKGFTLIELLVVISIIAILAVVVFVALDPVKRFADARDSRRWTDVNNLLTAHHQYIVDNGGSLPSGLSTSMAETQIGSCTTSGEILCADATSACVDLTTPFAKYLKSMPLDPQNGSVERTGYSVTVDENNIITISGCRSENQIVEVSR